MWRKIKSWLGLSKSLQRWDEHRRQQVLTYLEQKPSSAYTAEDWVLAAELIIHQYVPDHLEISQEDFEKVKTKIRAKIEKNLESLQEKPTKPIKSEKISAQEAQQVLSVLFLRLDILPDSLKHHSEFWQDLLDVCSKPWSLGQQSSFLFDRYADHNFDTSGVACAASATLTLYQTLLEAHKRGDIYVIGCSATNACSICQRDIQGRRYRIDDLLTAYHDPSSQFPLIPYYCCEYVNADGGGYCRCSWQIELQRPVGMSPEYFDWLNQTLKDAGLPSILDRD